MSGVPPDAIDWAKGMDLMAGPYFVGLYQPSPETVGFWDGVKQQELRLKYCTHCKRFFHPKRIVCTDCGTTDLRFRAVEGRGSVYSFSEIHRAPAPEFVASIPYTVGVAQLNEGVCLFTRFVADPGPIRIGAPARVAFRNGYRRERSCGAARDRFSKMLNHCFRTIFALRDRTHRAYTCCCDAEP